MSRWWRRAGQRATAAVLLLAVLAVPMALANHRHAGGAPGPSRDACAVCAATIHAPALLAPLAPQPLLLATGKAAPAAVPSAPRDTQRRAHATRGPPAVLPTLVA